jgi:hypothetical protein
LFWDYRRQYGNYRNFGSLRPWGRQVNRTHTTKVGKTEIGVGFLLVGAGVAGISLTALLSSSGIKPSGAKTPLAYAGGAGAAAVGVTLNTFGFHKRSAK